MTKLPRIVSLQVCGALALLVPLPLLGQAEHFSSELLPMVRRGCGHAQPVCTTTA